MTKLTGMAEKLVDKSENIECVIFGTCCVFTLLVFLVVTIKILRSPTKIPKCEFLIILLSSIQLCMGVWYYTIDEVPYLQILNKGIKVLQCEIISWTCIFTLLKSREYGKKRSKLFFTLFTILLSLFLGYSVIYNNQYLNLKMNIFVSLMWFAMSSLVFYIAMMVKKSFGIASLLKFDFNETIDLELQEFKRNEVVDNFADSKSSQFMVLSVMEFITSMGTLTWDLIIYYSVTKNAYNNYFELDMPFFKEFLYIISNSLFILIPNWTIFLVFYWLQRRNYSRISSTWDINLSTVRSCY
ncbi:conserved hypothetical protein [Theileria equi strain WA]|uniref:Uncharacterized protein n=1 Tax=Theileria equi strain WA TaxID=1537102 RepID=L1LCU8_THEEQ|nr:conserved hypothetical protein [Theileria equi strain WA]EKX73242.1 conserved hypothetical protein [Theileria equi strain WA]|eukprot:XP_004832694.1 conserved hypothetical protein [Theileria equi strain WA]